MLRDATHEAPIRRIVRVQPDDEGVLHLDSQLMARIREGDALAVPGTLPTCESCWTEAAVAIAFFPGEGPTFRGAACLTGGRRVRGRLVPLISSVDTG
jgi:hypothetical protein